MRNQKILIYSAFLRWFLKWIIGAALSFTPGPLSAQNEFKQLGSWNIISFSGKYQNQWLFFGEAQLRSLSFYHQFHYYEYKAGAGIRFAKTYNFFLGAGSYNTYSEGGNFLLPYKQKEVRVWQQLAMQQNLYRLQLEHRYRAEQRYTASGFKHRFRYRLGGIITLNKYKMEPRAIYLAGWNEVFFTNTPPYFERNRFFLGAGFMWNKRLVTQIGWVNQVDYKINDEFGKNFLQAAFSFQIDWNKTTSEMKTN